MTQVFAPPCERCGGGLSPYALVCPRCGGLARRAELERLSREAMELEPQDPVSAALRWRQCLQLLPPDAPQYAQIYHRVAALTGGHMTDAGVMPYAAPPAAPLASEDDPPGTALLKTGGSMLLSILVYTLLFSAGGSIVGGLLFATGFVVLILVHELGHVAAMRYYGLSASPPIFIPFMGAMINLRQPPQNAKVEAVVGIGGPIAGTVGALACYAVSFALPPDTQGWQLTYVLAHVGFLLNLFNLLPVPPLDGGRITAAVSPKVWMLGLGGLAAMIVDGYLKGRGQMVFVLILVLFMALPRIRSTLARRNVQDPYYAIGRRAVWTIGTMYVLLGALLLLMRWLTDDAITRLM